jgi:DNA-directed RNA polymerase subunit RPC12/RpoP
MTQPVSPLRDGAKSQTVNGWRCAACKEPYLGRAPSTTTDARGRYGIGKCNYCKSKVLERTAPE